MKKLRWLKKPKLGQEFEAKEKDASFLIRAKLAEELKPQKIEKRGRGRPRKNPKYQTMQADDYSTAHLVSASDSGCSGGGD